MRRVLLWWGVLSGCVLGGMGVGHASYEAQEVVRTVCRADALGARISAPDWAQQIAPVVTWPLEPAWDHVVLVQGYAIDAPRVTGEAAVEVDVRYQVLGTLSEAGFETATHIATVPIQVRWDAQAGWRVQGPPHPPHIFVTQFPVPALRRLLAYGSPAYVANSLLVSQLLWEAGWEFSYLTTPDLVRAPMWHSVTTPAPGDLLVYLRNGAPYHVGVWDDDAVVSATVNAGVIQAPLEAFPGAHTILRITDSRESATASREGEETAPDEQPRAPEGTAADGDTVSD